MRSGADRADARRNREEILRAALELLGDSPEVSMSQVARTAGVSRVTLYRHFADREALLDALIADLAGVNVEAVLQDLEDLPLPDALDALATGVVTAARTHPELVRAVAPRLEQLVHEAVAGEPVVGLLRHKRTTGELTSPLGDDWLARCVRALCTQAVVDERPAAIVTEELAATLRRLVC